MLRRVRDPLRAWIGTVVVGLVAVVLWFADLNARFPGSFGWSFLGVGLAVGLALVAGSAYRSRRDPSAMLVAAGSAAFATEWILYLVGRYSDDPSGWIVSVGLYGLFLGPLALAACLVFIVPWRDRRGRPPLRVRTVITSVAAPLIVAAIVLGARSPAVSPDHLRAVAAITAAAALVAAARAIARTGWYALLGAGAVALLLASAGAWITIGADTSTATTRGGLAWFTLLPSVALILLMLGTLSAQRADTSRMRRASDRATEVMEGRAEIASIVAHDVRGPAGTIRSIAGSLRTSYGRLSDDDRLEFVGMIEQESLRLLRVADQMSLGLKADAATLPYTMLDRDVEGPVLQGLHDAEAGTREVRLDIDGDLRASVDARWLAEAVRQGIENAMKFSPADTPIDVRVRTESNTAVIEIEDMGPAIPPDMREQVFEKFCRWRPHGYEDVSGSGLGLFIVRTIARAHGGEATVATGADDTGTILRIRLPTEATT